MIINKNKSIFLTLAIIFCAVFFVAKTAKAMPIGTLLYRTSGNGQMYGYNNKELLEEIEFFKDDKLFQSFRINCGHVGIYAGIIDGEHKILEAVNNGIQLTPAKHFINTNNNEKLVGAKIPVDYNGEYKNNVDNAIKFFKDKKLEYDFSLEEQKGPENRQWICVGLTEKIYESANISKIRSIEDLEYNPNNYAIDITSDGYDTETMYNKDRKDIFSKTKEFSKIERRDWEKVDYWLGSIKNEQRFVFLPYTQFVQTSLKDVEIDILLESNFEDKEIRGDVPYGYLIARVGSNTVGKKVEEKYNNVKERVQVATNNVKNGFVKAGKKTKEVAVNTGNKVKEGFNKARDEVVEVGKKTKKVVVDTGKKVNEGFNKAKDGVAKGTKKVGGFISGIFKKKTDENVKIDDNKGRILATSDFLYEEEISILYKEIKDDFEKISKIEDEEIIKVASKAREKIEVTTKIIESKTEKITNEDTVKMEEVVKLLDNLIKKEEKEKIDYIDKLFKKDKLNNEYKEINDDIKNKINYFGEIIFPKSLDSVIIEKESKENLFDKKEKIVKKDKFINDVPISVNRSSQRSKSSSLASNNSIILVVENDVLATSTSINEEIATSTTSDSIASSTDIISDMATSTASSTDIIDDISTSTTTDDIASSTDGIASSTDLISTTTEEIIASTTSLLISELAVLGLSGASDEFIELYNPTSENINILNWQIQYKSEKGDKWINKIAEKLPDKNIEGKHYFLISSNSYSLDVEPDIRHDKNFNFAKLNGHVRLIKFGENEEIIEIDKLAYGGAIDPEGESLIINLADFNSFERKANASSTGESMIFKGCDWLLGNSYDSNNNNFDFIIRKNADPQNNLSWMEEKEISTIYPDKIIDLNFNEELISTSSVQIFWSKGDYHSLASSSYYDLRYWEKEESCDLENNWDLALKVASSTIYEENNLIKSEIKDLESNIDYCFSLKVFNGYNFSENSNILTIKTIKEIIIEEKIDQKLERSTQAFGGSTLIMVGQSFVPTQNNISAISLNLLRKYSNSSFYKLCLFKGDVNIPYNIKKGKDIEITCDFEGVELLTTSIFDTTILDVQNSNNNHYPYTWVKLDFDKAIDIEVGEDYFFVFYSKQMGYLGTNYNLYPYGFSPSHNNNTDVLFRTHYLSYD